jgi:hypothetical protein
MDRKHLCPWCERGPPRITRRHGTAIEYRCAACGVSHVHKCEEPGIDFAFFPADIKAARSSKVRPLILKSG